MSRLVIVSCGKAKFDRPVPARLLYNGGLFRAARRHCEEHGERWAILSAKHGLIDPDRVVEPYDLTIGQLDADARRRWYTEVGKQFALWALLIGQLPVVELHAGAVYSIALRVALPEDTRVEEPLHGLQIGERLRWYAQRRAA